MNEQTQVKCESELRDLADELYDEARRLEEVADAVKIFGDNEAYKEGKSRLKQRAKKWVK